MDYFSHLLWKVWNTAESYWKKNIEKLCTYPTFLESSSELWIRGWSAKVSTKTWPKVENVKSTAGPGVMCPIFILVFRCIKFVKARRSTLVRSFSSLQKFPRPEMKILLSISCSLSLSFCRVISIAEAGKENKKCSQLILMKAIQHWCSHSNSWRAHL